MQMLKRFSESNSECFEIHANYAIYHRVIKDKVKAKYSINKA